MILLTVTKKGKKYKDLEETTTKDSRWNPDPNPTHWM
jgi:hypothetical protein